MDDTRGTRGTRVRRKQLNAILPSPLLSLASRCRRSLRRSVSRAPSSFRRARLSRFRHTIRIEPPPPILFLFLFLCASLPRRGPSLPLRPQAAKLNKHSYLHSISGALTSLDNPATESSPSSTTYEPRSSFRYTHTSRPIEFARDPPPRPPSGRRDPRVRFPESAPAGIRRAALTVASGTRQLSTVLRAPRADSVFAGRRFPTLVFHRADTA